MNRDVETIKEFWNWFEGNEWCLRDLVDVGKSSSTTLVRQLSAWVEEVCQVNWEVGPGSIDDVYAFCLCPRDEEDLEEATRVISYAPAIVGWEFLSVRPAKMELPRLTFASEGQDYDIALTDWSYEFTSYDDDRLFDVLVFAGQCKASKKILEKAAYLTVQLLLGDLAFVKLIDHVEIEDDALEDPTPIRYLREHLGQLVNPDVAVFMKAPTSIDSIH